MIQNFESHVTSSFTIEKLNNINKQIFLINICDYNSEEFEHFTKRYKNILQFSTKKIFIIFNTLNLNSISAIQCLKLILFLENMKPLHRLKLHKFSIIIKNVKIIEILNNVFKVVPPVRPYKLTKTIDESIQYVNEIY
tara:strand:+ start:6789 stop:7202 length:414 start_codon:yes stop_codon:yes gene_type:complete